MGVLFKGNPVSSIVTAAASGAASPQPAAPDRRANGGRAGIILQNEHATDAIRWGGPDVTATKGVLLAAGSATAVTITDGPLYVQSTTTNTPTVGVTEFLPS